jgi:hypothetical protein
MGQINTQNIVELQDSFNQVVSQWKAQGAISHVEYGISNHDVKLEDGLPWIEIEGKFTKTSAKKLIKELAEQMNIGVLFNRLESWSDCDTLYGVMDIHPDILRDNKDMAVPSYSSDPDTAEFMEDYGQVFYPKHYKAKV